MKVRYGFVSNSSSCSFTIVNLSNKELTLVDFVKETFWLIDNYNDMYGWGDPSEFDTQEDMLKSAAENNIVFEAGKAKECVFGDEQGTLIGRVYDYILRDGGKTENFRWYFNEYLR